MVRIVYPLGRRVGAPERGPIAGMKIAREMT